MQTAIAERNSKPIHGIIFILAFLFILMALPRYSHATGLFYTVSGQVTHNGAPLQGVTIHGGLLGSTSTGSDGRYSFHNALIANVYTLTAAKPGFEFEPAIRLGVAIGSATANFKALPRTHTVSGRVVVNGLGVAQALVDLGEFGQFYTDNHGWFHCGGIPWGTLLTVRLSKPGYVFEGAERVVNVVDDIDLSWIASLLKRTIRGRVLHRGIGLPDVRITAEDYGSVNTDINGNYAIPNVDFFATPDLTAVKAGLCIEPTSPFILPILPAIDVNLDFLALDVRADGTSCGAQTPPTYRVCGNLRTATLRGTVMPLIKLTLNEFEAESDANGNYCFLNVPTGVYRLTSKDPGWGCRIQGQTDFEDSATVTVTDSDITGVSTYLKPALETELYSMWNGFIDLINISEIVNKSATPLQVKLEMFDIFGVKRSTLHLNIGAFKQQDVVLNAVEGFGRDTYGLVRLIFSHQQFTGRTVYYRNNLATNAIEFAYTIPFANAIRGRSDTTYNTFQPSRNPASTRNLVANWITIVNLDSRFHNYTLVRYDQAGNEIFRRSVPIEPMGRRDIDGGHQFPGRNAVGLNEIIPDDLQAPYVSVANRYGYGAEDPTANAPFEFALPLLADRPEELETYVPVLRENNLENWVEIVNTTDSANDVAIDVFDTAGSLVLTDTKRLAPKAQLHVNVSAILGEMPNGFTRIRPSLPRSLEVQSMFYFKDPSGNLLGLTPTQSREPAGDSYIGSYNTYLQMENLLAISNISDNDETIVIAVTKPDGTPAQVSVDVNAKGSRWISLSSLGALGLSADQYGPMFLRSETQGSVLGHLYRMRRDGNQALEFVVPTNVQ